MNAAGVTGYGGCIVDDNIVGSRYTSVLQIQSAAAPGRIAHNGVVDNVQSGCAAVHIHTAAIRAITSEASPGGVANNQVVADNRRICSVPGVDAAALTPVWALNVVGVNNITFN